ncbi:hypothetical protein E2F47_27495 [Mycobacterium eburneum]|nr:hypothetical protein [Mycobacterium eburneum]TDH46004.1 hypothetical protein E2F47_27495 [Mycobacterium eburneum]
MTNWQLSDMAVPDKAVLCKKLQGVVADTAAAHGEKAADFALLYGLFSVLAEIEAGLRRVQAATEGVAESVAQSVQLADVIREIFPDGS